MRILHLYPELMNLYGEYGNVLVLKKHLEDQGLEVTIDRKDVEESIDFDRYDMIYMGSGTEKNQLIALKDLLKYKYYFKKAVDDGKVILFTGNAMELLGKNIDDQPGLDIVDFTVEITDKRYTGDVIVNNEKTLEVVGFINKDYEGYRIKNLFGTHIIGPVLVKNPGFMEVIVRLLVKEGYQKITYPLEEDAYKTTLEELRKRK